MRLLLFIACSLIVRLSTTQTETKMKMNAGIITDKLQETKKFYSQVLDFGVSFENDFYILLHTPDKSTELSFLKPNHPSQKPIFQKAFDGRGVYLTIEVEDIDNLYTQMKRKQIPIEIDIRDEVWGDRHFSIVDPNGIGIDLVRYTKPRE